MTIGRMIRFGISMLAIAGFGSFGEVACFQHSVILQHAWFFMAVLCLVVLVLTVLWDMKSE